MSDEWTPPETWLVLGEVENCTTHVDPADEPRIDAAVTRFTDSAGTRDELMYLTLSEGGPYRVLASRITSWWLCTPEHRMRNLRRTEWAREEEKAMRSELGLPWKEEE